MPLLFLIADTRARSHLRRSLL